MAAVSPAADLLIAARFFFSSVDFRRSVKAFAAALDESVDSDACLATATR
jgi:hypothetical protein